MGGKVFRHGCVASLSLSPELFAYQASIVRAEQNFMDNRCVAYDRNYRREALAGKNLDWSVSNARLYNKAITGRAQAIPRCSVCLQEDQACLRNPNRPWFGWFQDSLTPSSTHPPQLQSSRPAQSQKCCRRCNDGKCKQSASSCWYAHRCIDCSGLHPHLHCPHSSQKELCAEVAAG